MCGIVTIFNYNSVEPIDRSELLRIRDHMAKRGPDGKGEWYSADNRVGMGHRRLAIIDLSESGTQPMCNEDGTIWITYNGEIYNYQALRTSLLALGHRFKSNSDTEVIIHGYEEWGIEELLKKLRGMFAFALYDARVMGYRSEVIGKEFRSSVDSSPITHYPLPITPKLFIARDPFGIKPLYYADDGKTVRVASQVKALLAGGKIDTSPEPAGHVGFFLWGHVPEPYTLYKGIRSLPSGSYMCISDTHNSSPITYHPYYSITKIFSNAENNLISLSKVEMKERLREALLDTVKHHLISDVPVGVFLSAGLDSGTLVGLASEMNNSRLHTVTLAFKEYVDTHNDESALSTLVADHYHTLHETVWVKKQDFRDEAEALLSAMDQPSTDGVNSYFVSKAAVKAGLKVALSGLGGDELFGSYPSFQQIPKMARLFGPLVSIPFIGKSFRVISTPVLKHFTSPKYAGLLEYGGSYGGAYLLRRGMFMPWELPKLLDGEMVKKGWNELQTLLRLEETVSCIGNNHLKVSALEMQWYMKNQLLRDTDWASMAHSLEVRVPLVDISLLQALGPLLFALSKKDFALAPVRPLPGEVVNRGKTGFSVPVKDWMMEVSGREIRDRGLRSWTKRVYTNFSMFDSATIGRHVQSRHVNLKLNIDSAGLKDKNQIKKDLRILLLIPDAFGGHGGIALYNRDFIKALCANPKCKEVIAIPRLMRFASEPLPEKLTYDTSGLNNKIKYIRAVLSYIRKKNAFDLIICGHINLLPLAYILKRILHVPLLLEIYGIDAWQSKSAVTNSLIRYIDAFVSISEFTKQKFLAWSGVHPDKVFILPNAIDMSLYGPGPKNPELVDRYGLRNKTVIMTLGRLVSHERYKGFDEVIDLIPNLLKEVPDIIYIIVGDGDDRGRIEQKVVSLGISDKVIFTGLIPESEKADHYRLADAYIMPSRGEGFGFVFLEAMACGIPVIASKVDGSREAVRDGSLGTLVDPNNREELMNASLIALRSPKGIIPDGLSYYSFENFSARLSKIIDHYV